MQKCCSVMPNSLRPRGWQPTSFLCPRGFSKQEYWSGLPCPPSGDFPDPGIESASLRSPALADGFFTTSATTTKTFNPSNLKTFLVQPLSLNSITDFPLITLLAGIHWQTSPGSLRACQAQVMAERPVHRTPG